jgi:hypothetical protein
MNLLRVTKVNRTFHGNDGRRDCIDSLNPHES